MNPLIKLPEPQLMFRHGQCVEDPRDGLTLFGPLEAGRPYGIRYGVIGTKRGVGYFERWLERIQTPISCIPAQAKRPPFLGFETVFRTQWEPGSGVRIQLDEEELCAHLYKDDKWQRVYGVVSTFAERIIGMLQSDYTKVDIWFIVIPDDVYKYCRPRQYVEPSLRIEAQAKRNPKYAKENLYTPALWEEENQAAKPYHYEVSFHNQLKARVLDHYQPTQIIRESTISPSALSGDYSLGQRRVDFPSTVAWNLSTATFYKVGGRPWKLADIRDGVCYLGLVFKQDDRQGDSKQACCAAQMFLDSGDGYVFKGAVGPWYNEERGDYHLKRRAANELIRLALQTYADVKGGTAPKELFIHGQVAFQEDEWMGFKSAVSPHTNLVGVRIRSTSHLKLYSQAEYPVLRGTAFAIDDTSGYLWTRGLVPRLRTYPGMEVPNPLSVTICRGMADIKTVMQDIMGLTKLNYNACIFADGLPVTLRFADSVGEILTAGPLQQATAPPLPFKYYI